MTNNLKILRRKDLINLVENEMRTIREQRPAGRVGAKYTPDVESEKAEEEKKRKELEAAVAKARNSETVKDAKGRRPQGGQWSFVDTVRWGDGDGFGFGGTGSGGGGSLQGSTDGGATGAEETGDSGTSDEPDEEKTKKTKKQKDAEKRKKEIEDLHSDLPNLGHRSDVPKISDVIGRAEEEEGEEEGEEEEVKTLNFDEAEEEKKKNYQNEEIYIYKWPSGEWFTYVQMTDDDAQNRDEFMDDVVFENKYYRVRHSLPNGETTEEYISIPIRIVTKTPAPTDKDIAQLLHQRMGDGAALADVVPQRPPSPEERP